MKNLLLSAALALFLAAPALAAPMIGGAKDAHGCSGGAGYQWSVVQNRCIRAWEAGYRLDSVTPNMAAAFVVFAMGADQSRAELYLANEKTSLLARRVKPSLWQVRAYVLARANGKYSLSKSGKLLYQGAAAH